MRRSQVQRHRSGGGPRLARRGRALRAALVGTLLLPVLGSCAWFGEDEPPAPPACPAAIALEGAQRTTAFAPGGQRSSASIRWVAAINQVETRCRVVDGRTELDLRFAVVAEAGPAFSGEPVVLELFVATVGPDQRIRSRYPLAVRLDLDSGALRAGRRELLTFDLPSSGPGRAAERIYVGFQLDPRQAAERLQRLRR